MRQARMICVCRPLTESDGASDVRALTSPFTRCRLFCCPALSTCAIRPAAIFGDGEERHLRRVLGHVRLGLGIAGIGSKDTLCDWLYVDNLCHALILAASSLTIAAQNSPAAGSAYCISDDHPINNFEFLRPLCEGLGYPRVFQFFVPTWIMFHLAWALELLRTLLILVTGGRLSFQPMLTRSEVCKVSITHYFSMEKAKRDLGYAPIVTMPVAIERCIEYYREEFGAPTLHGTSSQERRKDR
jgi:nucleoside-diphosphate-sugar epimerase